MSQNTLAYKPAYTIRGNKTIREALEEMVQRDSNSLCVVSEDGRLEGVISIQDIASAIVPVEFQENIQMSQALYKEGFFAERCMELSEKKVKSVMRKQVMEISKDTNIMTVVADFLMNDLYNVPVTEDGKLVGVITRSDLRASLVEAMK